MLDGKRVGGGRASLPSRSPSGGLTPKRLSRLVALTGTAQGFWARATVAKPRIAVRVNCILVVVERESWGAVLFGLERMCVVKNVFV